MTQHDTILGRALLVDVTIGVWAARKHDRAVTERVNEQYADSRDVGRYHKRLFGGDAPTHSALITTVGRIREKHRTHTLPWTDGGWRILPSANFDEYTRAMRQCRVDFEEQVEAFLTDYPRLIDAARERLGEMFRADEYPTAEAVRRKFYISTEFAPIPSGSDFRVDLPELELSRMAKQVEQRLTTAVDTAMKEAWTRLGDAVAALGKKLDEGKGLRETMVARVGEVAEVLGRLNLTEDPQLERVRQRVLSDLATLDVKHVRKDRRALNEARDAAAGIMDAMQGVYAPDGADDAAA